MFSWRGEAHEQSRKQRGRGVTCKTGVEVWIGNLADSSRAILLSHPGTSGSNVLNINVQMSCVVTFRQSATYIENRRGMSL